ncbi:ABC transporter substrate-binding protein [Butyricicoccus pullicaecorum]|uniref:ABC transporter substrate-binding protein n=1 Tax=Butyricicoccus pullicaecorum TaxID=501571 RepID=A0A1Y4LDW6_9FIRM|nr:extracellular solute-binding protein [Butyricicoccus pullicaecorum]OUP54090.1 ABC transporter substrate-binding protein [Butyricicoccus pullicaecorum]
MNTKRLFAILTASALLVGTLAGCGGSKDASTSESGGETGTVKDVQVWATGSDNVRQTFEKLVSDFNANSEYAGTYEAKLNFILSGTGGGTLADQLVAAYKAGQTDTEFDVVDLGDDDLTKILSLTDESVLEDLDMSKIPNAEGVTAEPVAAKGKIQPYRGTTVILAYNSETVPEDEVPTTMDELVEWIKAHPGRFAYNTPGTGGAGDSFVRTSIYNFIDDESALMSNDPKWMEQWDEGFAFLKELHPYMYKSGSSVVYPNKNQGTLDLLTQGEIDMCPNWADMVLSQRKAGTVPEKIKITTIEPSFTGSVQGITVPSYSGNKEGGFAFIDYLLSPEAQTILVQDMAAIPLVTEGVDLTGAEELMSMDVSNFRTQALGDLVTDLNARWDEEIGTLG